MAFDKAYLPSELVEKLYGRQSNSFFNIVSRALDELRKKGLVKLMTPEAKTGRLYALTEKGKKIKKKCLI